ncbi:ABC transporter substrate-binding protein [Acidihalobacter ferrooxydans]|nr:ABC transporter substrate-binding protein [Acidihalobacter ferrooxydans]
MKNRLLSIAGLLGALMAPLGAYASSMPQVTLYLKWVPQYQFAGYLVAEKKGYYKDAGLDVHIVPGGPNINTVQEIADGAAQFGIQTAEPIFYAYSHGLNLTMLMADFQEPYEEFMVKKSSKIMSVKDFAGKTVGINIGGLSQLLLPVMLESEGVDPSSVHTVRKTISLTPFLSDRVPIWNGYVGNEPFQAMNQGVPVREFKLAKYVPNWYGDVLFAKSSYVTNHPDIVRKFVSASQKGWVFATEHPKETIAIIRKINPQKSDKALSQEAQAAIPLMTSAATKTHCFGWMDAGRVSAMEKDMVKFGGWQKSGALPAPETFFSNQYLSCAH